MVVDFNLSRFVRSCLHDLKPYEPGKPIDEVKRELGLDEVIKLASNENPLGASEKAKEAVKSVLDQSHIYPDGSCYRLKTALAAKLGVEAKQLIVGNGSDEIIKLLAETFLNDGDQVLAPVPSFSEYWFAAKVMNAEVIGVPLCEDFTYDVDAMINAVGPRTKLIYICNPNNPTGTYMTKSQLEKLLAGIPSDVVVVMDEAYAEFVGQEDYPDGLDYINKHRLVVLRTFSKVYGLAAYRVGYGIGHPELIGFINRVREPFNVNSFAQEAAIAALADADHVKASVDLVRESKELFYREFEAMGLKYIPTETNFIFVDTGVDGRQVFDKLMRRGVIVRSGHVFGRTTYIRVTFGTMEENAIFLSEFKAVMGEERTKDRRETKEDRRQAAEDRRKIEDRRK